MYYFAVLCAHTQYNSTIFVSLAFIRLRFYIPDRKNVMVLSALEVWCISDCAAQFMYILVAISTANIITIWSCILSKFTIIFPRSAAADGWRWRKIKNWQNGLTVSHFSDQIYVWKFRFWLQQNKFRLQNEKERRILFQASLHILGFEAKNCSDFRWMKCECRNIMGMDYCCMSQCSIDELVS